MPPIDFVSRGQALIASGNYQEAVKVCRLGLLGKPTQVDGRLILAQALLALRRYDEVLAEMRVALELDGSLAAAHGLKGEALLRKGDLHAAREALLRARQLAPGDPSVAALIAETDLAIAGGGAKGAAPKEADPATKHYPTHRGVSPKPTGAPGSTSFTRPAVAAVGERTGTVELDPEESGIEMLDEDDDLGDVVDPPTPLDEVEIDDEDVVSVASSSRDATVAGKQGARTPKPSAAGRLGTADLQSMFPDEDEGKSGLDRLLGELSGPPGASVPQPSPSLPLRAAPTGSTPLVEPGQEPPRKPSEDMRLIRAGLGLDPNQKLPRPQEDTGLVVTAGVKPRRDESSVIDERPPSRDGQRTRKVATEPGSSSTRSKKSRVMLGVYAGLALLVIAGGVWGGFQIRAMRLERQVAAAKRNAAAAAKGDTWRGWRSARDTLAGVVSAQDIASNRAALARAKAVLAGEFGDGVDDASAAVKALGDMTTTDADYARAELALATGDDDALAKASAALATDAPGSADALYIAGRLAMEQGAYEDAANDFDKARGAGEPRPLYLVGLARAQAARGAWAEARAAAELALSQFPDHPAAVIARARVLAASGAAPKDPDAASAAATALEKVLAEAERPVEEQAGGVSPLEARWAALALAELHVARGDVTAAKRALDKARTGPAPDREFAVATVKVLLAVGDAANAGKEADAAAQAWPTSPEVAIVAAQVAFAQGDAARTLKLLGTAGDLAGRPEALALRGEAHLKVGETDAATADLDAALAKAPDLEAALVARAELDLAAGNPRNAVNRLEKKWDDGASPELAVTYASALREVGERDRARTVLATLTGKDTPRPIAGRAWLETARLERDAGDARAARSAYTKAIELLPDATGAQLEAALLLVDNGDAAGARESLDQLAAPTNADGNVLVEAARVHVLVGDLAGAKTLLDRAETTTTAPRWQIARERGRVALRERSIPVAIEALERAASLQPSDGETRLLLIDAHLAKEDAAGAAKVLEDVNKRFAGMPEAQLATGRVRLYADAIDEAREAFAKAKDQLEHAHAAPRWIADATYWLARTTYYGGDAVRARTLGSSAVSLDPSLADCWMLLGEIDAEKNAFKAAEKELSKVTVLDPANTDAWFELGEAAFKAKDKKVAKTALMKYLELAPKGDLVADAKAMLAKL